jgi:hypothetical protein
VFGVPLIPFVVGVAGMGFLLIGFLVSLCFYCKKGRASVTKDTQNHKKRHRKRILGPGHEFESDVEGLKGRTSTNSLSPHDPDAEALSLPRPKMDTTFGNRALFYEVPLDVNDEFQSALMASRGKARSHTLPPSMEPPVSESNTLNNSPNRSSKLPPAIHKNSKQKMRASTATSKHISSVSSLPSMSDFHAPELKEVTNTKHARVVVRRVWNDEDKTQWIFKPEIVEEQTPLNKKSVQPPLKDSKLDFSAQETVIDLTSNEGGVPLNQSTDDILQELKKTQTFPMAMESVHHHKNHKLTNQFWRSSLYSDFNEFL